MCVPHSVYSSRDFMYFLLVGVYFIGEFALDVRHGPGVHRDSSGNETQEFWQHGKKNT